MLSKYPKLAELVSFLIAVNSEYADDDRVINSGDEVAIIPPTSGG
jgi:molybdopterin synthase sulfur carrier subunit